MELKVWVEGIQRVVCGVSEATTCQDVVVALAHATGKTGRFTLIEKWRDTERLLAPADYPLKALHKWGEYSSEVVFVLKHSEKHRKERSSKRTEKITNFDPHSPIESSDTPGKGIKKSLTFSGAHSFPKNHITNTRRHLIQGNSSLDSIDDQGSVTSHSSLSMSPYGSLEKRSHRHNDRSGYGRHSLEKHKTKGHRRKAPSPHSGSSSNQPSRASPKLDQFSSPALSPRNLTPSIEQPEECELDSKSNKSKKNGAISNHKSSGSIDFTRINGKVDKDSEGRGTSPGKNSSVQVFSEPSLAEKDDLAKLVKLQQEKLSVQATQLKVLDTEIEFLEARDRDCERLATTLASELAATQRRDAETDSELQELDLVSWADKLEIEQQSQKTLESEITLMRSRLSNCESELLQTKNRGLQLGEAVEVERKKLAQREQEQKEQELKVLQDISEVQKQLNERLAQYEKNQNDIEELQSEVKDVESRILEGKAQLSECDRELRGVNMEVFNKVPNSVEGCGSGLSRNSPSRPGSARRLLLHSPLLLKETVATAANPHGLWV